MKQFLGGLKILSLKPNSVSNSWMFLRPFSEDLWAAMGLTIVLIAAGICALEWDTDALTNADIGGRLSTLVTLICLLVPADVSQPQVVTNKLSTCFIQYAQVACWGRNGNGQLGRGNTIDIGGSSDLILYPIDLGDDFVIKQVAGGSGSHNCAVSVDGRLKCWGSNDYGTFSTP